MSHFGNEENYLKLRAELIKGIPGIEFNMQYWLATIHEDRNCGTIACIGGHIALMIKPENEAKARIVSVSDCADWLGVPREVACSMFYPDSELYTYAKIPKQAAIEMLDYYHNHGRVAWEKTCAEQIDSD